MGSCCITHLEGRDRGRVGGKLTREGIYEYLWLIHIVVCQKPKQHYKAIILQLRINFFKKKEQVNEIERKWLPTPIFLPGEFYGQRSLAGTVHGVAKGWSMAVKLTHTHCKTITNVKHISLPKVAENIDLAKSFSLQIHFKLLTLASTSCKRVFLTHSREELQERMGRGFGKKLNS